MTGNGRLLSDGGERRVPEWWQGTATVVGLAPWPTMQVRHIGEKCGGESSNGLVLRLLSVVAAGALFMVCQRSPVPTPARDQDLACHCFLAD